MVRRRVDCKFPGQVSFINDVYRRKNAHVTTRRIKLLAPRIKFVSIFFALGIALA